MSKVPYAAYLRVYEPLAAFPERERAHWADYARRERLPTDQDEVRDALRALAAVPARVVPAGESGDAFVTVEGGELRVCPWRTRLRAWRALDEVGQWLLPQPVLDAALPPVARRRAAAEYARWRERNGEADRVWIRSALWHVPVRWFALFADEEREFRPAGATGGPVLRYRTPMVEARRRVARALRTVRRAVPEGPLAEALTDVGRWIEEFHPLSLLELDYGGLVWAVPEGELARDRSAADAAAGLAALAAGDQEAAKRWYDGLGERWMAVRERQFAN
ncbi:hypothetical protein [Streptomyces sp. RFCAC02]|uniref:hypothetical protein n=1 Tax=Streptomyces sp. RFCAC02 TaxID=2499143 RepID=UPI0019CF846A|nr:hypothetical protein [Streptomyces sp. RFCAC02]